MTAASEQLREPWADIARQRSAAKAGMWVFLASEVLFFGALILAYAVNRIENPAAFIEAGRETKFWFGTVNTAVLLASSMTMAVASQAASERTGLRGLIVSCLAATAALGITFVIIKGFEYRADIDERLVPGPHFRLQDPAAQIFFALYWVMTGVHAIHLSIGIALTSRLAFLGASRRSKLDGNPQIEATALYWHLVDVIWVFFVSIVLPCRARNVNTGGERGRSGALWRRNGLICAALMGLLALTAILAYAPLGAFNLPISLAIGFAKAALVVYLFMEIDRSSALLRLAGAAGLVWLCILFALTLADVLARVSALQTSLAG